MLGKILKVYIGENCIAASRECSIEFQHDNVELIPESDWRWREYIEGHRSWRISVSGLVVAKSHLYDALHVFDDLSEPLLLKLVVDGDQTPYSKYGFAYPESGKVTASNNRCVTYNISFSGTGKLKDYGEDEDDE